MVAHKSDSRQDTRRILVFPRRFYVHDPWRSRHSFTIGSVPADSFVRMLVCVPLLRFWGLPRIKCSFAIILVSIRVREGDTRGGQSLNCGAREHSRKVNTRYARWNAMCTCATVVRIVVFWKDTFTHVEHDASFRRDLANSFARRKISEWPRKGEKSLWETRNEKQKRTLEPTLYSGDRKRDSEKEKKGNGKR